MTRLRAALAAWAAGDAGAGRLVAARPPRTVVLVEGVSDRVALETLAVRRGRDLAAERVCVAPMGGAMSAGRFLGLLGPTGLGVRLAGLSDTAEEPYVRRGLARAGLGPDLFFVCVADLEEELIRALGVAAVERVVADQGELRKWRTFRNQPAQRGRPVEHQLRRFLGTASGRKIHYAEALVRALDLARVPRPLDRLLAAL